MNRTAQFIRLLVRVRTWVREVCDALPEQPEAYYYEEEIQGNKELPRDKINAVVSFDEETIRNARSQATEQQRIQNSIKMATWFTFGTVFAYAFITLLMWCAMRESNSLLKTQWQALNRPWVGLSGSVIFPKPPVFQVFQTATPSSTVIALDWSFDMKNAGVLPASKVASEVLVKMTKETLQPPQNEMQSVCETADWRGDTEGGTLFPSSAGLTVNSPPGVAGGVMGQQIQIEKVRRIWVMGCIAYQELGYATKHHTRFWIVSSEIPENTVPKVIEQRGIVTFYTLPISGWSLVKTEAD